MPGPDQYSTHFPVLARVIALTDGPVLEIGAGWYSTPLLSLLCQGRRLVSLENDPKMVALLEPFKREGHEIRLIDGLALPPGESAWDAAPEPDEPGWSVVLIDHAPAERRKVELARVAATAEMIVIHDTGVPLYGLDTQIAAFRYRVDYKLLWPYTTVVSNVRDVQEVLHAGADVTGSA